MWPKSVFFLAAPHVSLHDEATEQNHKNKGVFHKCWYTIETNHLAFWGSHLTIGSGIFVNMGLRFN